MDTSPFKVGRWVSRYTQDHAVILDYDGVLPAREEQPAVDLIRAYNEAGHVSDEDWEAFEDALTAEDTARDRELEGELLYTATTALEGEERGAVRETTEEFVERNRKGVLAAGAHELLEDLQDKERDIYIVSNNYRIFFESLAEKDILDLDMGNVHANVLDVEDNGNTLTGKLSYRVFDGKAAIADAIAKDRYIWAAAGDSVSDLPLLEAAEHAYGVSPSDELAKKMAGSGWEVFDSIGEVAEEMREKDRSRLERWLNI